MIKLGKLENSGLDFVHQKEILDNKISRYRKLLCDYNVSDNVIQKRLEYLENLCRSIIKNELQKYVKAQKNNKIK